MMFDYTYGIRTTTEYVERVKSELARLEQLQDEALPEERKHEVISAATQAAITLWHLSDFIFRSPDADAARVRAKIKGKDIKDFQERVRNAYPSIRLCWEMTNGAKHFRKKPAAEVGETTVSMTAQVSAVVLPLFWKASPKKKRRPKVILPDRRRLRAADIFRDAIAEWEHLLRP
jgi:hypothetical protein